MTKVPRIGNDIPGKIHRSQNRDSGIDYSVLERGCDVYVRNCRNSGFHRRKPGDPGGDAENHDTAGTGSVGHLPEEGAQPPPCPVGCRRPGGRPTAHGSPLPGNPLPYGVQRRAVQYGGAAPSAGFGRTYLPGPLRHRGGAPRLCPMGGQLCGAVQRYFCIRRLGGGAGAPVPGPGPDWGEASVLHHPGRTISIRLGAENAPGPSVGPRPGGRPGRGRGHAFGTGPDSRLRRLPGHPGGGARMLRLL